MDNISHTRRLLPATKDKQKGFSPRTKKIISISALVIFIAFSVAAVWFIGKPMLNYIEDPALFRTWVDAHGILGRLAFVGMVALQIVIALIPGEPLEIGAGYAFGFWEGSLLCIVGSVIGSVTVFLLVRKFGVKIVEAFFPIEKIRSLKFLQNEKRLNFIVFFLFFIPGTPKDLMAYFVGLTSMKLSTWIFITGVARIPSIITSTIAGNALGIQDYRFAIIVFAATLVISLIGLLVYREVTKKHQQEDKDAEESQSITK